ncbi:MAG: YbaK/EbsC family protein [Candidatus Pacebacteria bacterium]|nr:YbaK/EbsC family protein [Candidatus Paceibacterota bacterium]
MPIELFEKFIKDHNLDITTIKSEISTKTAQQAADAHGVPVCNIVKSLVVKTDNEFLIVLCPGNKKLDFEKLEKILNKKEIRMANANEVKENTGHSVGGVPPFGHKNPLKTIILNGFESNEFLWAAAGAANNNFKTTLSELKNILKQNNLFYHENCSRDNIL